MRIIISQIYGTTEEMYEDLLGIAVAVKQGRTCGMNPTWRLEDFEKPQVTTDAEENTKPKGRRKAAW
jgi:hypothetical protein